MAFEIYIYIYIYTYKAFHAFTYILVSICYGVMFMQQRYICVQFILIKSHLNYVNIKYVQVRTIE